MTLAPHSHTPPSSLCVSSWKKGIIKFCLSAVSIIFLKPAAVRWQLEEVTYGLWAPLLTGNDSPPPPHIWEVLKSFWWATHEQGDFVRALDYQYHRKRIFPRVSVLLCWWRVFPESCLCRLVLGFNETQKLFEREVSLKMLTLLLPYLITLQTWTRGGSSGTTVTERDRGKIRNKSYDCFLIIY